MTFWSNALSTLIGAFSAFVLGVASFYITEQIRSASRKTNVLRALAREFSWNITVLTKCREKADELISQVGADERELTVLFTVGQEFSRVSLSQCLGEGYLWDLYEDKELADLNDVLMLFNSTTDVSLNHVISEWKEAAQITPTHKQQALRLLRFYRDELGKAVDTLTRLAGNIRS